MKICNMDVFIQRFHHIASQIFDQLDSRSIKNSRQVAKLWKNCIDDKNISWIRILKIPNINIPKSPGSRETCLHVVAKTGQSEIFEMLLEHEEVKNPKNFLDQTPFHFACQNGHFKIADTYMQRSQELNIQLNDKDEINGWTAFHYACNYGHTKIVEMIMQKSIEINIELNAKDLHGRKSAFNLAVERDHSKTVEMLLDNSTEFNIDLKTSQEDRTAFHFACVNGKSWLVEMILQKSDMILIDLNAKDRFGKTAFHLACSNDNSNIAEMIITESGHLNIELNAKDRFDRTAFHLACSNENSNIAEMIIEESGHLNIELNSEDNKRRTPFHYAFERQNFNLVEILIQKTTQINLDQICKSVLESCFQKACEIGYPKILETLLQKYPEMNKKEYSGMAGIHLAIKNGHSFIVEMIIQKSDDPNIPLNLKDSFGCTPLLHAFQNGNFDIAEMFLQKGIEDNIEDNIGLFSNFLKNAFYEAFKKGYIKLAELLVQNSNKLDIDLNVKDEYGWTAFNWACINGHSDVANILIQKSVKFNIELNKKDDLGWTPFHWAVFMNKTSIVKMIILSVRTKPCIIDINAKDIDGRSAFHLACQYGHLQIAEILIKIYDELNIELNAKARGGWTGFYRVFKKWSFENS